MADKLLMDSNKIEYKGMIEAGTMFGVLAWILKGKPWDANCALCVTRSSKSLIGKEVLHLI